MTNKNETQITKSTTKEAPLGRASQKITGGLKHVFHFDILPISSRLFITSRIIHTSSIHSG